jgi:parvulin-like peptidyl-prolyl isomerase
VLLLALPGCTGGIGTYFAPTAAVVGGTGITEQAVVAQFRITQSAQQLQALLQGPHSALNRLDTKRQILSILVRQQAVVRQARRMGVRVADADVQAAIDNDRQGASPAAFARLLDRAGVTLGELTAFERVKLTVNAVSDRVTRDINATPDQIAAAYQADKATYDAQFDAAHILICGHRDAATGQCATTPADLQLARSVDGKALAGADFGQLARQYSIDTSTKDRGGDLGWQSPSSLVPAFEQAALALQPGQVTSQPVQTPFGYHVIKLIGRGRSLAAASDDINARLEQAPRSQAFAAWLRTTMGKTPIRINPTFGEFDARTLAVVAPKGAEPSPPPAGPAGSSFTGP